MGNKHDDSGAYEVGYGRPPKDSRFRKGQSGNPKGRPKGSLNAKTLLRRELARRIVVREAGQERKVTKLEATIMRFVERGLNGDPKILTELIRMGERFEAANGEPSITEHTAETDQAILDAYLNSKAAPRTKNRSYGGRKSKAISKTQGARNAKSKRA